MTAISIAYFVLGMIALVWPLTTLFFKRDVLGAQWLMMTALMLFGLSVIVYSTFFNTFLQGEYVLVIIYMLLSMSVPPMTQMAVTSLTRRQGVSRMARTLVFPSLTVGLFMAVSVIIGGADMYRLWIERGADAIAGAFYPNSWRYNLIVAVHFYFYWAVLVAETAFVAVYSVVAMRRFRHELNEYYTANTATRPGTILFYITISVNCIAIVLSYIIYPFNRPRPLWGVILFVVVQSVAVLVMGWISYRTSYGAERLDSKMRRHQNPRSSDIAHLSREIVRYVETEKQFLNPDLSVFLLSEHFRVSQDDVVDAIHRLQGAPFNEFINALRVEHALARLEAEPALDLDDPDQMAQLAHSCGYLDTAAFRLSFQQVMQMSPEEWVKR